MYMSLRKYSPSILLIAMVALFTIQPAFAQGTGGAPWEGGLQTIVTYLTGTTARLLAIIAVAAAGILAMFGQLQLQRFFMILIGITIVFGAATIVDLFSG